VNGFVDHLYTPLGTTSNYSALDNLHTLQITTAHAKPQSFIIFRSRCLVTALNNGDSSASVHTSLPTGQYYSQPNCQFNYSVICSQPSLQNSNDFIAPAVLAITSRHGPHRKHRSSIVGCAFVATGTCLPSCCLETVTAYSPISRSLHSNGCTRCNIRWISEKVRKCRID
jgi:hypothetical protein